MPAKQTAPAPEPSGVVMVLESFTGDADGGPVVFRRGELADAAHPAVLRWPSLFGPVHITHRAPARAGAAPSEKRGQP